MMLWRDTQLITLAVMFLAGAGLALANDILGLTAGWIQDRPRRRRKIRPAIRLWDLVLWLVVTPCVFAAALVSDYGRLRVYVFVGLAAGAGAYILLGRPFVVAAGSALRAALVRGVGTLVAWAARPVALALGALARVTHRLGGGFDRVGRRLAAAAGRLAETGSNLGRSVGRLAATLLEGFRRRRKE